MSQQTITQTTGTTQFPSARSIPGDKPNAFQRALQSVSSRRSERRYRDLTLSNLEKLDDRRLYDLGLDRTDLARVRELPLSRSARQVLSDARSRKIYRR